MSALKRKCLPGLVLALAVLGVAGCGSGDGGEVGAAPDTLTRRQKDSLVGTLPVPGAGAVQGALEASDAARARAEAHDTIG